MGWEVLAEMLEVSGVYIYISSDMRIGRKRSGVHQLQGRFTLDLLLVQTPLGSSDLNLFSHTCSTLIK